MKGIVTEWFGSKSYGFISGEDGRDYFIHASELKNAKKLSKSNIVKFDCVDEGKSDPRAINVRKVGHGKSHPFANDIRQICENLESGELSDVIISSTIKKLKRIERYFCETEDVEKYPDIVKFFS